MNETPPIFVFEGPTVLRWGDLDAYGHVNNVRFFDYFQDTRVNWLTRAHVRMDAKDYGFVVVHISCDFAKELNYPCDLVSTIEVLKWGRSSITLRQRVLDQHSRDVVYGEGNTVMVWRDHQSGRSHPMPESLIERLTRPWD